RYGADDDAQPTNPTGSHPSPLGGPRLDYGRRGSLSALAVLVWSESQRGLRTRARRFNFAVARLSRCDERSDQCPRDSGHVINSVIERRLVRFRRAVEAAQLPDEL